jgi:hypothetical protein
MKMPEPLLYLRADCHLCEQVIALLEGVGVRFRPVDIDGDAELTEEYGLRIPVLRLPGNGHELDYPFDEERLRRFLGL